MSQGSSRIVDAKEAWPPRRKLALGIVIFTLLSWEVSAYFIDGWQAVLALPILAAIMAVGVVIVWALGELIDF